MDIETAENEIPLANEILIGTKTVSPTHPPETDPIVVAMFCANELYDVKSKPMLIKNL